LAAPPSLLVLTTPSDTVSPCGIPEKAAEKYLIGKGFFGDWNAALRLDQPEAV
jgi:hypothetical protein